MENEKTRGRVIGIGPMISVAAPFIIVIAVIAAFIYMAYSK